MTIETGLTQYFLGANERPFRGAVVQHPFIGGLPSMIGGEVSGFDVYLVNAHWAGDLDDAYHASRFLLN